MRTIWILSALVSQLTFALHLVLPDSAFATQSTDEQEHQSESTVQTRPLGPAGAEKSGPTGQHSARNERVPIFDKEAAKAWAYR